MGTVYNIRGTSGSGKTTLARAMLARAPYPIELNPYPAPTKREPGRQKRVTGYVTEHFDIGDVGVIGTYGVAACGGMDTLPSFDVCRGAIKHMFDIGADHVIAEGLLASTVYGSWGEYAEKLRAQGHEFAFCYLSTPVEVCMARVRARQAAAGNADKSTNWGNLRMKHEQVLTTRTAALAKSERVYDLPYDDAENALRAIMRGEGEMYRG